MSIAVVISIILVFSLNFLNALFLFISKIVENPRPPSIISNIMLILTMGLLK